MHTNLSPEEASLLESVLFEYLTDLRGEIAATDDFDYRSALKRKAETLREILLRLETANLRAVNTN